MVRLSALVVAAAVAVLGVGPANAQDDSGEVDYFSEQKKTPLTYRMEGERTGKQKTVLVSLAGAALLTGGLGVYFNLESNEAADEVSRLSGDHSGLIYTPAVDKRRRDAIDNGNLAIGMYVAGGALLAATVVAFVVTSPDDVVQEYDSGTVSTTPYVAPIEGGVVFGKAWTY